MSLLVFGELVQEADIALFVGEKLLALLYDFLFLDRDVADGVVLVSIIILVSPATESVVSPVVFTISAYVFHLFVAHI